MGNNQQIYQGQPVIVDEQGNQYYGNQNNNADSNQHYNQAQQPVQQYAPVTNQPVQQYAPVQNPPVQHYAPVPNQNNLPARPQGNYGNYPQQQAYQQTQQQTQQQYQQQQHQPQQYQQQVPVQQERASVRSGNNVDTMAMIGLESKVKAMEAMLTSLVVKVQGMYDAQEKLFSKVESLSYKVKRSNDPFNQYYDEQGNQDDQQQNYNYGYGNPNDSNNR